MNILRALLPCLAFVMTACQPATPPMSPQETAYMDALTQNPTPRCVGRYMIDLPENMTPVTGPHGTEIEDVKIEVTPMNQTRYELALKEREHLLKNQHMDGEANNPYLKSVIKLANNSGLIFNRARATGSADVARTLELWSWRDNFQMKMSIDADDPTDPKYADHPRISKRKKTIDEKLAHLLAVYSRTRGRADTDIPTEPGFCFAHGFVAGKAGEKEKMNILYAFNNVPDVSLGFEYDALFQEDTSLLDRGKEINAMLKNSNGRSLRKGKNKTGGVSAEEWLMTGNTDSNVMGHTFTLESSNKTGREDTPFFVIDMQNGNYWGDDDLDNPRPKLTKATLSEAQAIVFWERVTATLRPRPNAF